MQDCEESERKKLNQQKTLNKTMYEEIEVKDTDSGYKAAIVNSAGEEKATVEADTAGDALREIAELFDQNPLYD